MTITDYHTINVVAGCILRRDDKFLLVQEKAQKVYGLWNLPAGKVDIGETIENAAVREVKEESGFDVRLGNELAVYHSSTDSPVVHVFNAEIVGGELHYPVDELLDAKWLTLDEIKTLDNEGKLRTEWLYGLIRAQVSGGIS